MYKGQVKCGRISNPLIPTPKKNNNATIKYIKTNFLLFNEVKPFLER
ncbi:hypothetical protein JMUB7507_26650 [Staphylococcus aureus]